MMWKEIKRSTYKHSLYRSFDDVTFELPDGRHSVFTLEQNIEVVCVFALTSNGNVVLARQFRPGPNAVLDELPGGIVEDGEDIGVAIKRELLEETGYAPGELTYLGKYFDSAYSQLKRHAFLARNCERVSSQALDQNEFIEVVLKPVDQFIEQIIQGQSTDIEVAWAGLVASGIFKRV